MNKRFIQLLRTLSKWRDTTIKVSYTVNRRRISQEEWDSTFGPAFKKLDEGFEEMSKAFEKWKP